jgi:hypothetical protein
MLIEKRIILVRHAESNSNIQSKFIYDCIINIIKCRDIIKHFLLMIKSMYNLWAIGLNPELSKLGLQQVSAFFAT